MIANFSSVAVRTISCTCLMFALVTCSLILTSEVFHTPFPHVSKSRCLLLDFAPKTSNLSKFTYQANMKLAAVGQARVFKVIDLFHNGDQLKYYFM